MGAGWGLESSTENLKLVQGDGEHQKGKEKSVDSFYLFSPSPNILRTFSIFVSLSHCKSTLLRPDVPSLGQRAGLLVKVKTDR